MRRRYERKNRYTRENIQNIMAAHVRDEQRIKNVRNYFYDGISTEQSINIPVPNISQDYERFEFGVRWFNKGRPLEIAPTMYRNDPLFVNGYMRAKRLRKLHITLYCMGVMYANDGWMYDEIEEKYRASNSFILGYTDAMCETEDNTMLYYIGVKYAEDSWMYDELPYRYRINNTFVMGYVDAMNNRVKENGLNGRSRKRG